MVVKRTEVNKDQLYEVLKSIQAMLGCMEDDMREIKEILDRIGRPRPVEE